MLFLHLLTQDIDLPFSQSQLCDEFFQPGLNEYRQVQEKLSFQFQIR